jgi:hypothetical protein
MKSSATIEHVRRAITQLATRLMSYRTDMQPLERGRGWLLPDLSHLLPEGPVDVDIPDQQWGTGLQHLARRDWLRLSWLLWLAGYDRVTLPSELRPQPASLPVYFMGIAREQFLGDGGVDLSDRLSRASFVDESRVEELQTLFSELAPATLWSGTPLSSLSTALIQFARDDEIAFGCTFKFWNVPDENDLFADERGEQADDDDTQQDDDDDADQADDDDMEKDDDDDTQQDDD